MQVTKHRAGWGGATFWMMSAVVLSLWLSGVVVYTLPAEALPEMTPSQESLRRAAVLVHGVCSWLFGVMLGRGVWPHVRVMWHRRSQTGRWIWGVLGLAVLLFLTSGGLVLQYGSPALHDALSPWHFWTGAVVPVLYAAHTWGRFVQTGQRVRAQAVAGRRS